YFRHLFQELPIILAPGAFLAAHKRHRPQSTAERSKWEDIAGFDSVPDQLGDDPWVAALIDGGIGNQHRLLRPPDHPAGSLIQRQLGDSQLAWWRGGFQSVP